MKVADLIDVTSLTYKWEVIETIPQFAKLKECEQSPKWHSEGNVWNHTVKVCKEAINACELEEWPIYGEFDKMTALLAAALFHDIGKGIVTAKGKDGNWHAYNHEFHSEILTREILWDEDVKLRETICSLVRYHMEPLRIFERKDYLEAIVDLSKRTNLELLTKLKTCDIYGSIPQDLSVWEETAYEVREVERIADIMKCLEKPSTIGTKDTFFFKRIMEMKDKKRITAYVMIGLPGSGKSTEARNIVNSSGRHKDDYVILSRDDIRAELGYCAEGDKVNLYRDKEKEVNEVFKQKMLEAAKNGKILILDNTNLRKKYRDEFKTILSNYYVEWNFVYVEAKGGLETNMKRRNGQIEERVFGDMLRSFDWPLPSEYDSFSIITA